MQFQNPAEEDLSVRNQLILAALSGLVLRLISLLFVHPSLTSDPLIYHDLARSLIENGTYALDGRATAYRPPGYPFFLAGIGSLTGSFVFPARIVQSLLDVMSCLLLYRLGKKLYSNREGVVAAAILAVYIPGLLYSQTLFAETLFTFLFLILLNTITTESQGVKRSLKQGVILGLCVFVKPLMILFPCVMFLWELFTGETVARSAGRTLLTSLVMIVVISPWVMRNRMVFGEWLFTTNGGINFWIGNNPRATGAYRIPEKNDIFQIDDEVERNRRALEEAAGFVTRNPLEALGVLPRKFFFFFSSESAIVLQCFESSRDHPRRGFAARYLSAPSAALIIVNLPYYALLFLALPSLILDRNSRNAGIRFLLIAALLFWITVHLAFFGSNRFHAPVMVVLTLFGARSLTSMPQVLSGASRSRMVLLFGLMLLFSFLWIGEWIGLLLSL